MRAVIPLSRHLFSQFAFLRAKQPLLWLTVVTGFCPGISFTLSQVSVVALDAEFVRAAAIQVKLPIQIAQANPTEAVLMVDPTHGNDTTANGSQQAPFKTISAALQVAAPGTTILLAPGIYSAEAGEMFPLKLKSGVTILGNSETRGQNILIQGSGLFLSPTFARQNVTVLGANQAAIAGVTITNPHPQGYGLWIESTSPVVTDSTFTGSGHDGVSVTGTGSPKISNSYFYQNGANGITIYGTSRAEVRDNIFEKTGFAINVNQKAAPLLIGNRITQNKDGIVVQASAQPILRNNSVEGNERDGLVAIAQSRPDLGTSVEPGGNFFRNNGQFDINAKASNQMISAVGNEVTKTTGQLELGTTSQVPVSLTTSEVSSSAEAPSVVSFAPVNRSTAMSVRVPDALPGAASITLASAQTEREKGVAEVSFGQKLSLARSSENSAPAASLAPGQSAPVPVSSELSAESFPVPAALNSGSASPAPAVSLPVPKIPVAVTPARSLQMRVTPTQSLTVEQRGQVANSPAIELSTEVALQSTASDTPIPISVPLPESRSVPEAAAIVTPSNGLGSAQSETPELLPVPSADVPIGNGGDLPTVVVDRIARNQTAASPPAPPTRAAALGFRYRVLVETENEGEQAKLRSLVPGAFRTSSQGRILMQAGAFTERDKADELMQFLDGQGFRSVLDQLE